jgi:AraC-like DNA-binding protein
LYGDQSITSTGDILIRKIGGLFQKKRGEVNEEAYSEKSTDLERIIAFIEQEKPFLQVGFTLHDLSQELNIPYIRVINCFKKELNTSFPAYRKKLRIAHAISLMRAGAHLTISIDGIAERAGFKSKSIFYTAFKEEHGMTPTEWMKRNL